MGGLPTHVPDEVAAAIVEPPDEHDRVLARVLAAHPKSLVAIAMAWAAGYVDVVTWLALYQVYSSHMTGNTSGFARDLAAGRVTEAFHYGWPIVPFVVGLIYSAATTKLARRHGIHSSFSIALFTELLLLTAFLLLGLIYTQNGEIEVPAHWMEYLMLSLPCAAMGMQTVTVTRINGLRVYTTYLTGTLSKFAEAVVEYVFWWKDRLPGRHPRRIKRILLVTLRQKSLQHAALTAGLWIGFFTGGVCGALLEARYSIFSLIGPMAVLACAIIVDLLWPVAAADEPMETDSAH